MARCGCGGACSCALVSSTTTTVTGAGTPANPWKVDTAFADCSDVRACITANQGAAFDQGTGIISVCVSPNANNGLTRDANGCLYVATGASTVTAGCGITGTGAPGNPLVANTTAWPYACAVGTNGGVVTCDPATGRLYSEPRGHASMSTVNYVEAFANLPVPAANTTIRTISGSFTNPDPCRTAIAVVETELEFDLNLPPNSGASYGYTGDDMVQHSNRGATTETNFAIQTTKVRNQGTIAPGATVVYSFDAILGNGFGGATYTNIQGILRLLFITQ